MTAAVRGGGELAEWAQPAWGTSLNSNSDLVSQIHCLPNPLLPLMGACCLDASSPQPLAEGMNITPAWPCWSAQTIPTLKRENGHKEASQHVIFFSYSLTAN